MVDTLTNEDLTIADKLQVSTDGKYTVHGSGTFDDLMESITKHLSAQFSLGRLQGSEYAQVYTASVQAAMSNAVQYLLGKANTSLIAAQILLTEAQTRKVEREIQLMTDQEHLLEAQQAKTVAEKELLVQKKITEQAQTEAGVADPYSVLGEQTSLYREQSKGFFWNAKKNWAKLTVDAASVDASQGEGFTEALSNSSGDRGDAEPVATGGTVG